MPVVSKSRFKARALEYMRDVERDGRPLTITDRGRPVLQITAIRDTPADWRDLFRDAVRRFDGPLDPATPPDIWESL